MLGTTNKKQINYVLLFLCFMDIVLPAWVFFFQESFIKFVHGEAYAEPTGLLERLGIVWFTFLIFHIITLIKWQKKPHWLVLSAGIRFTEMFADAFYIFSADDVGFFGWGFLSSPPANFLLGLFLLKSYEKITEKASPA